MKVTGECDGIIKVLEQNRQSRHATTIRQSVSSGLRGKSSRRGWTYTRWPEAGVLTTVQTRVRLLSGITAEWSAGNWYRSPRLPGLCPCTHAAWVCRHGGICDTDILDQSAGFDAQVAGDSDILLIQATGSIGLGPVLILLRTRLHCFATVTQLSDTDSSTAAAWERRLSLCVSSLPA